MTDLSKTIRHPVVIHDWIDAIINHIAWLRNELATAEEELRQMNEIALEMLESR